MNENNILLELYFENLNIGIIDYISNKLLNNFKKYINYKNIISSNIEMKVFTTPERLIFNLSFDKNITYLEKGIKLNDTEEHLKYFLKKINVINVDKLEIINERYCYKKNVKDTDFIEMLNSNIKNILFETFSNITISNYKNILLHLKNILFIENNKIKSLSFNNINSNNITYINNNSYLIDSIEELFSLLKENNIFFLKNERKKHLKNVLMINDDNNDFIENVLFIKEKPIFFNGKIKFTCNNLFLKILGKFLKDKYYLYIQEDFLYFMCLNKNNIINTDEYKVKVEKAILKINNFKINKKNKENKYIFNENKLNRLSKLTKFICLWIPYSNIELIDDILDCSIYRSINLFNSNSELKLLLNKYLLLKSNKNKEFIDIIMDSFKPMNKKDDVPTIPLSIAISIGNKIDNIIYFAILNELKFNIDKKEEKDIYFDIIKIIIKNRINLPLKLIFEYSLKSFINETVKKKENRILIKKYKINKDIIINNILEKFYIKLYYYLLNVDNFNDPILNFLVNLEISDIKNIKNKCDILILYNKIKKIYEYFTVKQDESRFIFNIYKRINNLLLKYKKIKIINKPQIIILKRKKFANKYEKDLYDNYYSFKKDTKLLIKKEEYYILMEKMYLFSCSINNFLNNNFIENNNIFVRNRQIRLLYSSKLLFGRVLNFNKFNPN